MGRHPWPPPSGIWTLLLLGFVLIVTEGVAAQSADSGKLALVGGMLLDGYETPPIHHAAILIEGDRIVAAGPASHVDIPADAEIVDTHGMTMLPGLIDLHVHLMILGHGEYTEWFPIFTEQMLPIMQISAKQLLLAGVTTAVDLGAPLEILTIRDGIAAGEIPGPRLLVSGPWITRRPWEALPSYFQYAVDGPREAADRARELIEAGVDVIKTWRGMREDDIRAVVQVAHASGIPVHSHLYAPDAIWDAIRGGTDVIQHAGSGGNPSYPEDLVAEIAHRAIPVVQTISHRIWVYPATVEFPERLQDQRLREDLPRDLYEEIQRSFQDFHRLSYFRTTPRQIRNSRIAARQFIDANAVLGMGTDSGSPMNFHTESAWREISALVDAGMSPLQAISAATKTGAEVIGRGGDLGTIEPGKLADVIVVRGNPLFDINALGYVEHVVKNGVRYK